MRSIPRTPGCRRVREEPANFHARLGRFHAGKYFCRECDSRRRVDISGREVRRRTDGRADRLVSQEFGQEHRSGSSKSAGGIAGDFPICVVPLITQDLREKCRLWGYFCQISDSTTSYGSYSGAVPNEKITWGKLDATTPATSSSPTPRLWPLSCSPISWTNKLYQHHSIIHSLIVSKKKIIYGQSGSEPKLARRQSLKTIDMGIEYFTLLDF